ncbi:MAG: hypothetical protein HUU28_16255 [Planctomycetaceae bacterium]|nr:hypothetical protein [Planctomycetaceae bacterium]
MRLAHPRLWLGLLSLAVVVALVLHESEETSPGPLTRVHAAVPELVERGSCERCHGDGEVTLAAACSECHPEIGRQLAQKKGFHGALEEPKLARCGACHGEHHGDALAPVDARVFALAGVADRAAFRHDFVDWRLVGVHERLECSKCHRNADVDVLASGASRFLGLDQRCSSCHEDPHKGQFEERCDSCHGQETKFTDLANFVHTDELPLRGAHAAVTCVQCHPKDSDRSVEAVGGSGARQVARACQDCHESPHTPSFVVAAAAQLGLAARASCVDCHSIQRKGFAVPKQEFRRELHAATGFRIDSPHEQVKCEACHASYGSDEPFPRRYPGRKQDDCAACHADPHAGQFVDERGAQPACVSCHALEGFKPHRFDVAKHATTAFPLEGQHVETRCEDCHARESEAPRQFVGTKSRCEACHTDVHGAAFYATVAGGQRDCESCHDPASFEAEHGFDALAHARRAGFELAGAHERAKCEACHRRGETADGDGRRFGRVADVFGKPADSCATCHADVHAGKFDLAHLSKSVEGRETCERCHTVESFADRAHGFDHGRWTWFGLVGAHARAECDTCHKETQAKPLVARARQLVAPRKLGLVASAITRENAPACTVCHADVHEGSFDRAGQPVRIEGREGCARCHTQDSFASGAREAYDHALWAGFALEGQHARAACEACHVPTGATMPGKPRLGRAAGASCSDCHTDPHVGQFASRSCEDCHRSAESFATLVFDHTRDARFALDANHVKLACSACHKPWPVAGGRAAVRYKPLGTTCVECHGFEKGKNE